jgi:hypothetical protein
MFVDPGLYVDASGYFVLKPIQVLADLAARFANILSQSVRVGVGILVAPVIGLHEGILWTLGHFDS